MLLWPFNKYPGTDYETFNWEWILKTVKVYTNKVDDFIADITKTWNAFRADITKTWNTFRAWTTGQIDQMHDDFANYVNVTEGALNTGAIADGAITEAKINAALLPEITNNWVTPEMFGAVGDGLTNDTNAFRNAINDGRPIILKGTYLIDFIVFDNIDRTMVSNNAEIITIQSINPIISVINSAHLNIKGELTVTGPAVYTAEFNHGIMVQDAELSADILKVENTNGDGLYFNNAKASIDKISVRNNSRNGFSVVSGDVKINTVYGYGGNTLSPKATMDIEPNDDDEHINLFIGAIYDNNTDRSFINNRYQNVVNVYIGEYYSETTILDIASPGGCNVYIDSYKGRYTGSVTMIGKIFIDTMDIDTQSDATIFYTDNCDVHINNLNISAPNAAGLIGNNVNIKMVIEYLTIDKLTKRNIVNSRILINKMKTTKKVLTSAIELSDLAENYISMEDDCNLITIPTPSIPTGWTLTVENNTSGNVRVAASPSNSIVGSDGTINNTITLTPGQIMRFTYDQAIGKVFVM